MKVSDSQSSRTIMAAKCSVCNEAKTDDSIRVDGVTRCDECESKQRAPQHAAAVGNQSNIGGEEVPMVISMLLCFMQQCHMNRTVKTNIIECVDRYFLLDDALQATDLLCDMYGNKVTYKVKARRNTVNKMKADSIVEDWLLLLLLTILRSWCY